MSFSGRRSWVFLAESAGVQAKWLHFVKSANADSRNLHDVMFLCSYRTDVGGSDGVSSTCRYAESHMRSLVVDDIKVGAAPFVRNLRMLRQHGRVSRCCLVELVDHQFFQPTVHRRSQCGEHQCVHRRRNGSRARAESCAYESTTQTFRITLPVVRYLFGGFTARGCLFQYVWSGLKHQEPLYVSANHLWLLWTGPQEEQ